MSIGYACLLYGAGVPKFKSCVLKNATPEKLRELIKHNLSILAEILDYNAGNNIRLFRLSSDIIPFASHPVNDLRWWEEFFEEFSLLGGKIRSTGQRVSMHPGQYTVINSPDSEVVERAIKDIEYHHRFLKALGTDQTSKIVLHVGGIYGDKSLALLRFAETYKKLAPEIKERLIIENDEKSYTFADVLNLSAELGFPVVFDNLHHRLNPSFKGKSEAELIALCAKTWKTEDGTPKIHYSQQDPSGKKGAHSPSIATSEFLGFYHALGEDKPDIMLEVKDKNRSAIKCLLLTAPNPSLKALEAEWARYKYLVLSYSQAHYLRIRRAFGQRTITPRIFYSSVEEALSLEETIGNQSNAAEHVWGYFKKISTPKEKSHFQELLQAYQAGNLPFTKLKAFLWKMTLKYDEKFLLKSYYF